MLYDDTIAAVATAQGTGGIGIVRISGAEAKTLISKTFLSHNERFTHFRPWTLHHGHFLEYSGQALDDVLVVFMPGPRTFTGEDVAEIHCHGGSAILQSILTTLMQHGARLAERGEFSRRAFMHGRMDLTQAEAIAEMIAAPTKASLRVGSAKLDGLLGKQVGTLREKLEELRMALCVAVDFPEEEVECLSPQEFLAVVQEVQEAVQTLLTSHARCRHWQEGASVVLAGAVNAGKSSLLNALLGYNRALVTDIPGTTRDFLEEYIDLDGLAVRITDTAGLREGADTVERLGIERSRERIETADAVLLVLDGALAEQATEENESLALAKDPKVLVVWNKSDLAPEPTFPPTWQGIEKKTVCVCAHSGKGLDALSAALKSLILKENTAEPDYGEVVPNMRQAKLLQEAAEELAQLATDIDANLPYDVCAVRLDAAVSTLGNITGLDTPDEVMDKIFANFCIGK